MKQKEEYLVLKEKYDQLQAQSILILKEQKDILEKLEKICPHPETSEPFEDILYGFGQTKVCKVCQKTLYHDTKTNGWS